MKASLFYAIAIFACTSPVVFGQQSPGSQQKLEASGDVAGTRATLMKAAAHFVSIVYSDQATEGQRSRAEEYWSRQYDRVLSEESQSDPGAGDPVPCHLLV